MTKCVVKCHKMTKEGVILKGGYIAIADNNTYFFEEFIEDAHVFPTIAEAKDALYMITCDNSYDWYTELISLD